jgi:hypothetical protein
LPKPVKAGPHTEPKTCLVKQLESGPEVGLDEQIFVYSSAHTDTESDIIGRTIHSLLLICVDEASA